MAVPIYQKNHDKPVLGAIVLTLEPVPSRNLEEWLIIIGLTMLAGGILLAAMVPFGAIFGFFISRGLSKRLKGPGADRRCLGTRQLRSHAAGGSHPG